MRRTNEISQDYCGSCCSLGFVLPPTRLTGSTSTTPRPADAKALPFSDGVLVGGTLYVAGHIGLDAKTGQPPASAEEEAKLVMDEIKQTVESAGMTMDDVVNVQIFCTDLEPLRHVQLCVQNLFSRRFPGSGVHWRKQIAAQWKI